MRSLICFVIALPLAVPAQAPGPSLSATATEVLLDLVVRDRKARIVRDLRPEEIQVFEDGAPQKLRHFEFFEGRSTLPAPPAAAPAVLTAPAPPASSPAPARDVHELREVGVVSVVVSSLDPQGRKVALDAMHDFIKDELRPNTYVGVFWLGPNVIRAVQPYTNDAEKVLDAVNAAVTFVGLGPGAPGQRPDSGPGPDKMYVGAGALDEGDTPNQAFTTTAQQPQAGLTGPEAVIARLMATAWVTEMHDIYQGSMGYLMPLRTLVQSQADIPGRKVVLLFMAGLPVHPDTVEMLKGLISAANRSNVSLYAIDIRGFERSDLDNARRMLAAAAKASMAQQMKGLGGDQSVTAGEVVSPQLAQASIHANTRGNLAELAEGTGGALLSPSDLRTPLRRAMEEVRTHYELSYSPSNTEADGRFRKIEVKVSRPGCTVFARSGYYALPLVNGRQVYPFEMATLKALNSRPLLRQFDFHAVALEFRPGLERTQLSFAFQAPTRDLSIREDKQWATVHVAVTALVKDERGQVVEKISKDIPYQVPAAKAAELRRGVVSFTAPFLLAPGRYTIETAAVDRESTKASVRRALLVVVGQASGLAMSDVALVRRVDPIQGSGSAADPLQARGGKVTPELSDTVSPEAGGHLRFYAVAYPPAPFEAPVEAGLEIWRDGQAVLRTPASEAPPDRSGAAPILASVPVEKLPPGQYEVQVTFHFQGQKVTRGTAFTVEAGK